MDHISKNRSSTAKCMKYPGHAPRLIHAMCHGTSSFLDMELQKTIQGFPKGKTCLHPRCQVESEREPPSHEKTWQDDRGQNNEYRVWAEQLLCACSQVFAKGWPQACHIADRLPMESLAWSFEVLKGWPWPRPLLARLG